MQTAKAYSRLHIRIMQTAKAYISLKNSRQQLHFKVISNEEYKKGGKRYRYNSVKDIIPCTYRLISSSVACACVMSAFLQCSTFLPHPQDVASPVHCRIVHPTNPPWSRKFTVYSIYCTLYSIYCSICTVYERLFLTVHMAEIRAPVQSRSSHSLSYFWKVTQTCMLKKVTDQREFYQNMCTVGDF